MSWYGKLLGGAFGFLMGGPLGAVFGAALGHQVDQEPGELRLFGSGVSPEEARQLELVFFTVLFQVMGHMAKSDGRVSPAELDTARSIMNRLGLSPESRIKAMKLFNEGKSTGFELVSALGLLQPLCMRQPHVRRVFMAFQTEVALSDGPMKPVMERELLAICGILQFSRYEFYGIRTRLEAELRFSDRGSHGRPSRFDERLSGDSDPHSRRPQSDSDFPRKTPTQEAYAVLGLNPAANLSEIKRAYRRLLSQHHPDKMTAKGASLEEIAKATRETQKLHKAYELLITQKR